MVKGITEGVLSGLNEKVQKFESDNVKLKSENAELKSRVEKLEGAVKQVPNQDLSCRLPLKQT